MTGLTSPAPGSGVLNETGRGSGGVNLLNDISIELLPEHVASFDAERSGLPRGALVFVTHIGGKPLHIQVEAARLLKTFGLEPVCHLGARNFVSVDEYAAHLSKLGNAGVRTVLMIGGNSSTGRPAMHCSSEMLTHPIMKQSGIQRVFFAGHPEGHTDIPAETLRSAIKEKVGLARDLGLSPALVTQFAFDGGVMTAWAGNVRRDGIDVPIRFGVAGVTSVAKLIKFAMFCGVGASLKGLTRQGGSILKAMREQDPGEVIEGLETGIRSHGLDKVALHFFPFGGWERTTAWVAEEQRRRLLTKI